MSTMLTRSARPLRFIAAYAAANLQAALEYRSAFAIQVLTMLGSDCLWLFFWWTYFHQFPLTHGWQATDIVILWSVTASGYGLSADLFGNAPRLVTLILNGSLDAYLTMPRNVLLHVCIAAASPSAWGDIFFAAGAYLLLLHPDLAHIVLFILLALLVMLIFTAFIVLLCSLAFFIGNTEGLSQQMMGALISFSTYPLDIFHGFVRLLLFTLVPAGFVSPGGHKYPHSQEGASGTERGPKLAEQEQSEEHAGQSMYAPGEPGARQEVSDPGTQSLRFPCPAGVEWWCRFKC
jgi:ABC-2 type transport system permease protein